MPAKRNRRTPSPEVVEKRLKALRLRRGGATYSRIAQELKCAGSTAHEYVMDALRDTQREPAEAVRRIELERLDAMHMALWPTVIAPTVDEQGQPIKHAPSPLDKARAVERCLDIQGRRAKLLGLDAPQRRIIEIVSHDEITRLTEEMKRRCDELEAEGISAGEPTEWADRD